MPSTESVPSQTKADPVQASRLSRNLLLAGILIGPVFYLVSIAQMFFRSGYDFRRHPISLLLLGDRGWIQVVNFWLCGALTLLYALGVRRLWRGGKAGTWGPLLIGVFGLGLLAGGLFVPDPGLGFPPGAPAGQPTTMSGHSVVHAFAFQVGFLALIAACFVFSRRFGSLRQTGWMIYSIASGVLGPACIVLSMTQPGLLGLLIAVGAAFGFGWLSVTAAKLRSETALGT